MPIGTVKHFNEEKGYGFIEPDDGTGAVFVHASAIKRAGLAPPLIKGDRLAYDQIGSHRGKPEAHNLQLLT